MKYRTLQELFFDFQNWDQSGVTFIESSKDEYFYSYRVIYEKSIQILAGLQKKGIRPGDELVIQLEKNEEFIFIFWACIAGGIIAVPLRNANSLDQHQKVASVCEGLNNPYLISTKKQIERLQTFADSNSIDIISNLIQTSTIVYNDILLHEQHGDP